MEKGNSFTIVIKLGTSSICDEHTHEPRISNLSLLVETAVRLRRDGHRVVIVSSGGIAMGLRRLDLPKRPKKLAAVQALAALGQCRLIRLWDDLFDQLRQPVAQILLTRNDVSDRSQYLNAANTFDELLTSGVIPIVNENDTLATQEIRFGDNDTLSAITAAMVGADYLFLMTDVDCLYTDNPRVHADAKPIAVVDDIQALKTQVDVSTPGSSVGTGGMSTKIIAAELATSAGVNTIILNGSTPGNIFRIVKHVQNSRERTDGHDDTPHAADECPLHTRFVAKKNRVRDRSFWLLHTIPASGTIVVDMGAYKALTRKNRAGLLAVGIVRVDGHFGAQEAVRLAVVEGAAGEETRVVGKAIVNYSSSEIDRMKGSHSSEMENIIGYSDTEYVSHRDNLAFY